MTPAIGALPPGAAKSTTRPIFEYGTPKSVAACGSALDGPFPPDVVDENLTHRPGRQRQEVLPVNEAQARSLGESYVRLVNQCSRGQRLVASTAGELHSRQTPQVLVRDAEELTRCVGITFTPGREKLFNLTTHR